MAELPADIQYLACSSKYGYVIIGNPNGFAYCPTAAALKASVDNSVLFESGDAVKVDMPDDGVTHVCISCDQLSLLVASRRKIDIYDVPSIANGVSVFIYVFRMFISCLV